MHTDEIIRMLLGGFVTFALGMLTFLAKGLLKEIKDLTLALQNNTEKLSVLATTVARLDVENRSLRRSHDAVTRHLIAKGILPPPDGNHF